MPIYVYMCVYIHIHTQFEESFRDLGKFLGPPSLNLFFGKFLQAFSGTCGCSEICPQILQASKTVGVLYEFLTTAKQSKACWGLVTIKDSRNSITTNPFFQVVFLLQYVIILVIAQCLQILAFNTYNACGTIGLLGTTGHLLESISFNFICLNFTVSMELTARLHSNDDLISGNLAVYI